MYVPRVVAGLSLLTALVIGQAADGQRSDLRSLDVMIRALQDPAPSVRETALRQLTALGPRAARAAPALVRVLEHGDWQQKNQARDALIAVGPDAVGAVVQALAFRDTETRRAAAYILGHFGAQAHSAMPALVRALSDHDVVIQCNAVDALRCIGDQAAVAPLGGLLRTSPHGLVRERAATALCAFGPRAKAAIPDLLRVLRGDNSDWDEAAAADAAASALASTGADAVAPLVRLVADHKKRTAERALAISALSRMNDGTVISAIPTITAVLVDKDPGMRYEAAKALEKLGPAAKGATARLRVALRDPEPSVRIAAASALLTINRGDDGAVSALTAALRDNKPAARVAAVNALWVHADQVDKAIPALMTALRDPVADIRIAAASALGAMGPRARQGSSALARAASDPEPFVRNAARLALGRVRSEQKQGKARCR